MDQISLQKKREFIKGCLFSEDMVFYQKNWTENLSEIIAKF